MKTRCSDMQSLLNAFLDGVLSEKEQGRVETHLNDCDECRREVSMQMQTIKALETLPLLPCPDRVVKRIEEAIPPTPVFFYAEGVPRGATRMGAVMEGGASAPTGASLRPAPRPAGDRRTQRRRRVFPA